MWQRFIDWIKSLFSHASTEIREEADELKELLAKVERLKNVAASAPDLKNRLTNEWQLLSDSEKQLIALCAGDPLPESAPGEVEYGPLLYLLHHLPSKWAGIEAALILLGMPKTQISKTQWEGWTERLEGAGFAAGDGTLVAGNGELEYFHTYVQLDPGWALAAFEYLYHKALHEKSPCGTTPSHRVLPFDPAADSGITLAMLGDWGTGLWRDGPNPHCPSDLVIQAAMALNPDFTIHLGDVYYAGTPGIGSSHLLGEETHNFIDLWKTGSRGSYTLNSNHEMYPGGKGYFGEALTSPLFAAQQGTSWFALEYGQWLVLGLDSAYFDPSPLYMKGALFDPASPDNPQVQWLKGLNTDGKKILVLTHHTGLWVDGSQTTLLWEQLAQVLGRAPDLWYWGHVHNGAVYAPHPSNDSAGNPVTTRCRCNGHAAIPFAGSDWLADGVNAGKVLYYPQTPIPNPSSDPKLKLRVCNGFAQVRLFGDGRIEEAFFEVGAGQTGPVWTS